MPVTLPLREVRARKLPDCRNARTAQPTQHRQPSYPHTTLPGCVSPAAEPMLSMTVDLDGVPRHHVLKGFRFTNGDECGDRQGIEGRKRRSKYDQDTIHVCANSSGGILLLCVTNIY